MQVERGEHAVPAGSADRGGGEAGRQGVGDGDGAGGDSGAGVADREVVGRSDLALGEVSGVGLVDRQVDRHRIVGRVVIGDRGRIAAAGGGGGVDDRSRGVVGDVDRQCDRRVAGVGGQDVGAGAGQCCRARSSSRFR